MEWDQARIADFQEYTITTPPRINNCESRVEIQQVGEEQSFLSIF